MMDLRTNGDRDIVEAQDDLIEEQAREIAVYMKETTRLINENLELLRTIGRIVEVSGGSIFIPELSLRDTMFDYLIETDPNPSKFGITIRCMRSPYARSEMIRRCR